MEEGLGGQALAALAAAAGDHIAAANGGHAGAEAMAAGADELAGLISALHDKVLRYMLTKKEASVYKG
jgi:hypothetical protein